MNRRRRWRLDGWFILAALLCWTPSAAAQKRTLPPDWVSAALASQDAEAFAEADAVVLLYEVRERHLGDGRYQQRIRIAIRVQTEDGRSAAQFRTFFNAKSDRVRRLTIHLGSAAGTWETLGRRAAKEWEPHTQGAFYNETRVIAYDAGRRAQVGTLLAVELELDRSTRFAARRFSLNGTHPTLRAEVQIELPPGWTVEAAHHDSIRQRESRLSRNWTALNLPAREPLALGERLAEQAVWLRYTLTPPPGEPALLTWKSWEGVGAYLAGLFERNARPDDALRAQAEALAATATTTEEKIRAVAHFAQSISYAAVAIDLQQGGGYEPHPASQTLRTRWGDCKDKSNLMVALLQTLGIEAYPLIVYAGYGHRVDPSWPAPHPFNHCIVAIVAEAESDWPAQVEHPELGSLLLFDPTAQGTLPGTLPPSVEGDFGLLGARVAAPLISIPTARPEANRTLRKGQFQLYPNGDFEGTLTQDFTGKFGTKWRQVARTGLPEQQRDTFDTHLRPTLRQLTIREGHLTDEASHGVRLSLDFEAYAYARSLRGRLLIFAPTVLDRQETVPSAEEIATAQTRGTALVFVAERIEDHFVFTPPPGFVPDEIPESVTLDEPFGFYRAEVQVVEGELHFHREREWRGAPISEAGWEAYRQFCEAMRSAETDLIVLRRE